MILIYYIIMLIITLVCCGIYYWKWHKHFSIFLTICYFFFPIENIGYILMTISKDLGEAITSVKLIYLGGCFLPIVITLYILSLCKIELPKAATFILVCLNCLIFAGVLTIGHGTLFYKEVSLGYIDGYVLLKKTYGPVHTIFYIMIALYFLLSLFALGYSYVKKPDTSRKNIWLLFCMECISILAFFVGRRVYGRIEMFPIAYNVSAIVFLIIADRICLYDVENTITETNEEEGEEGYLSFDFKNNYLGSNSVARNILPFLKNSKVDKQITDEPFMKQLEGWIADFRKDDISRDVYYDRNMHIYHVKINYLYDGRRKRGYLMYIKDETGHQQYLKSIEQYNKNLKKELETKNALLEKYKQDMKKVETE